MLKTFLNPKPSENEHNERAYKMAMEESSTHFQEPMIPSPSRNNIATGLSEAERIGRKWEVVGRLRENLKYFLDLREKASKRSVGDDNWHAITVNHLNPP